MATVDLGKIRFNWQGAYNNSTAYVVNDVVSSGGNSYICILASTGNAVSNGTYWSLMAQAGTNGTNGSNGADGTDVGTVITTQGDVLYRDGSGLQRLGAGSSGQFLKTQGTGANPVWADAGGAWSVKTNSTFSSSTSLEITGLTKTTKIFISGTQASSAGLLRMRVGATSGGSFDSGASDYWYSLVRHSSGSTHDMLYNAGYDRVPIGYCVDGEDFALEFLVINPAGHSGATSSALMYTEYYSESQARKCRSVRKANQRLQQVKFYPSAGNMTGSYTVIELN